MSAMLGSFMSKLLEETSFSLLMLCVFLSSVISVLLIYISYKIGFFNVLDLPWFIVVIPSMAVFSLVWLICYFVAKVFKQNQDKEVKRKIVKDIMSYMEDSGSLENAILYYMKINLIDFIDPREMVFDEGEDGFKISIITALDNLVKNKILLPVSDGSYMIN